MFCLIWQKQENQELDSQYSSFCLSFLSFFSVFLLFSVCFIPIREGNDDFSATWKLDWIQEKILLTDWLWGYYSRPLFPCLFWPPHIPSLLPPLSLGLSTPGQASLSERREVADCFAPGFCSSVSCLLFFNACDNVEEFPSQPFPSIPCVPWRDGRKPTRLYEADNHRCF